MVVTSAGAGAIEHECGAQVLAVRGEPEGFPTAPGESYDGDLAVGGGQILAEIDRGIKIRQHACGIEGRDRLDSRVLIREFAVAATVGSVAAEQVGYDDDEPFVGQFVRHLLAQSLRPKIS
jgi:hypothetical protein